ncbi:hypothetical protein AAG906_041064 [Vitis piasezkii]
MVDGFRWKPILRVDQCGSAREGISHFIWRFMDPHGLARSSSLTGCSLRLEPPESHPARPALLGI